VIVRGDDNNPLFTEFAANKIAKMTTDGVVSESQEFSFSERTGIANGRVSYLANPTLELHDGSGNLIANNDDWRSTQEAENWRHWNPATKRPRVCDFVDPSARTLHRNRSGE
jgi:hypothetical protein